MDMRIPASFLLLMAPLAALAAIPVDISGVKPGPVRVESAKAWTEGDRVEVSFAGLRMGIFSGEISYVFYPSSRLIEQRATVSTNEPDTAFFYSAGIRISNDADVRPGGNMESEVAYYDTEGKFLTIPSEGPERHPV